jgi:hypothetical protein
MKNLDLNAMGVEEMSKEEKVTIDGGVPMDWYMDDATIAINGRLAPGALGNLWEIISLFI